METRPSRKMYAHKINYKQNLILDASALNRSFIFTVQEMDVVTFYHPYLLEGKLVENFSSVIEYLLTLLLN